MNIIEELFYGNIAPLDKTYPKDSEIVKIQREASRQEELLHEFFTQHPEEDIWFRRVCKAAEEVRAYDQKAAFLEGFRLGARFLAEALVEPGDSEIN